MPDISTQSESTSRSIPAQADTPKETCLESKYWAIGIKAVAAAAGFRSDKGKSSEGQRSSNSAREKGEPRET